MFMLLINNVQLVSLLLILPIFSTVAKTKTYQVEILIFETQDEAALSQGWPLKPGKPSIINVVHIDSDKQANFTALTDDALKLVSSKRKIENNYHLILHKGWRQTVTDKESAFGVHVTGGSQYHHDKQEIFEVEGLITLTHTRQLNIDTDLVFRKPMQLISKNGQMGKFAEITDKTNWEKLPNTKLQAFRLTDSSHVTLSDMHYIDHPLYGVIILITPEKTEKLS